MEMTNATTMMDTDATMKTMDSTTMAMSKRLPDRSTFSMVVAIVVESIVFIVASVSIIVVAFVISIFVHVPGVHLPLQFF
jgi:hypothetical protein